MEWSRVSVCRDRKKQELILSDTKEFHQGSKVKG